LAHLHRDLLFSAGPVTLERFRVCNDPRAPDRRYRLALCSRDGQVAARRSWSPLNGGDPRRKDRLELILGLNVFLETGIGDLAEKPFKNSVCRPERLREEHMTTTLSG
jgi:hypothetical protein